MREERWRQEALGTLGEAFERAPKPDLGKLVRIEGEKAAPAPLESEELVQKFHKQRHEDFYEKISAVDRPREPPAPLPMESVQLKPAKVQIRELPKEEMEKVGLRPAPRYSMTHRTCAQDHYSEDCILGSNERPSFRRNSLG